ncbi:MAG: type III pantothenate kinase [Flavobacteriaceae bacterium]|nr:MAG: type III pantothenate kinase [Flavobacteriaceae bacterium]
MLLAVNIGNSTIRFCVFDGEKSLQTWTISSKPHKSIDEYVAIFSSINHQDSLHFIDQIAIGSVVPALTQIIGLALKKIYGAEPVVVDRNSPSEITHQSNQLGTDLYANAVAAHKYFSGNKLIIDFGTALTFSAVDKNGAFLGVVIAPGVITALSSLTSLTAQLPDIELKKPDTILGKDTETCMQSGMIHGYTCLVEGMIEKIKTEVNDPNLTVIVTGGLGHIFSPILQGIQTSDKLHTVRGIRILYENILKGK